MKLLVLLWKIEYVVLNVISILILAPVIIVLSYFPHTYNTIYFLVKVWAHFIFYGLGMRYQLHAIELLQPDENYIIISNHTSVLDIMLMVILHPQHPLLFIGKKELVKIPLFGTAYKKICIMVDRDSLRSRARVYRMAAERIQEGRSLVIFPEGGVTEDENEYLLPFKEGAFAIAHNGNIPLVAYTIVGMKKAFPFSVWKGGPSKIQVYRERIVSPKEMQEKSAKVIKEEIEKQIEVRLKNQA